MKMKIKEMKRRMIQGFDESKNRSIVSVSTLQELGSQMMEYYSCMTKGNTMKID